MRFRTTRFLNHSITALFGVLAGVCYERTNGFSNLIFHATAVEQKSQFRPFLNSIKTVDDNLNRTSTITKFGFPSFDNVRNFQNFIVGYDKRLRNPKWTLEHLNESILTDKSEKPITRAGMEFFSDTTIHPFFRTSNDDYKNSGFDRGHLAAAGNHRTSHEDMSRTFVLSNVAPQVGIGFNRHIWNVLEVYTRYRAKRCKNLWVCTGPLYLAKLEKDGKNYVKYEVIGRNQVAVPTHFFKVLLIESYDGNFELENYLIENTRLKEEIPLTAFQVPLDVIERSAGFLIFDDVPNKSQLKQNQPNKYTSDFKFRKRTSAGKLEDLPLQSIPAA